MEQYVCQRCSEVTFFSLIPNLDPTPDYCIYCGEVNPQAEEPGNHQGTIHSFGVNSWRCSECGATGSHPLGHLVPFTHVIGARQALEPFTD